MYVSSLWLTDFRCYHEAELVFSPGVTVISGANAQGKTTLLEAVAWASRGKSFRGVPDAALVRDGCEQAILRAEVTDGERRQLLEAELRVQGRNRVQLNRQNVTRTRDLRGLMLVSVFAPDDLQLVKGGPAGRRDYLDELLTMIAPRYEAIIADFERVLKQRNALLRGGMRGPDASSTLDVFDVQLASAGSELVRGRLRLLERLVPTVERAYAELAGSVPEREAGSVPEREAGSVPEREAGAATAVDAEYECAWSEAPLAADDDIDTILRVALESRRRAEIDRGTTLAGPHRDEWRLRLEGLESRTHASQGEQRTLALALRLGGHQLCAELTGTTPVLLLDDVFSELDELRSSALTAHLTEGQTLITTAGHVPDGVHADRVFHVAAGRVAGSVPERKTGAV
jgi:DNA replication and repair protein RecF